MAGADPPLLEHLASVPVRRQGAPTAPAVDVRGVDLDGAAQLVHVALPGRWSLLVFLGARCDGCQPFWEAFAAASPPALGMAPHDSVVVVTHEPPREDAGALRALVAGSAGGAVVMSDNAWPAYRVLGPPFFVLVDGEHVISEGVAWSIAQVAADVRRARERG